MPDMPPGLDLAFNPFEPAASGPPLGIPISPPRAVRDRLSGFVETGRHARGPKVMVILGDYGTGKTCLLRWLQDHLLPERRIQPFYFDNPGVHFYDLANTLLRTIGRKDFAKFIWEFAGSHLATSYQEHLFRESFEEYLSAQIRPRRGPHHDIVEPLQSAIMSAGVTSDEEIAHCLARIVTDAVRKPYFEYRDFLPAKTDSLVAEAAEAPYFGAILTTLARGSGAAAIAFLIDEFEEIGLQKRLTKRAAHDYLSTLKRLINLTQQDKQFWLFLSMTPDAYQTTRDLEPALVQRFAASVLRIEPLPPHDALTLIQSRLHAARPRNSTSGGGPSTGSRVGSTLFPFPDDLPFRPTTRLNPRRLVKACSSAISAARDTTPLPFSTDYLKKVESKLFANETDPTPDDPRS